MSELLDIGEFRRLARQGAEPRGQGVTALLGRPLDEPVADAARTVRFCFSDGTVDRVGDSIDPEGWVLDNFRRNSPVLFAHQSAAPPVGRCPNVFIDRRPAPRLLGDIEFAPPEIYEFADTVYRLVRGGFLNACSVGFLPIDYVLSKDGGIHFRRQELLEVSICPVPANANALIAAQAKGLVSGREVSMMQSRFAAGGGDLADRRARVAALATPQSRRAEARLPPRADLVWRFAGTLESRNEQVDRAYPDLRPQELRAVIASANRDTEAGRRAVVDAFKELEELDRLWR